MSMACDGTVLSVFDVNDNGRGPHIEATIRIASDGTIASLDAKGHHDIGAVVEERFTRDGSGATWKSREESGSRHLTGAAFFVPMAEIPEVTGMLAHALLKAGGTLPLLPAGEAKIDKVAEATVRAGAQQRHLIGYAITGLALTPTYVWMNDDGSWFGVADPSSAILPEGWEGVAQTLVTAQQRLTRERDAAIATQYAHKPPEAGFAYTHARVLDVGRGTWLPDQTVVVSGGIIRSVVPSARARLPRGAEVVDLGGKALLPGLWDMHNHLYDASGVLDIASGVTTMRDVGSEPDQLDDYKARFDDGTAVGPRVIRYGLIEGRGPEAASSTITAETEGEAKAAVEFFAKRGYEGIKIYNSVRPELVPLLVREAHARGMGVTGHVPVHMFATEVVRDGYDGIEHINMVFLNFLANRDTDTRTPLRFSLMADKGAGLDLNSKPVQDFFGLLRTRKTLVTPTLVAFEDLVAGQQGKITPGREWIVARVPVQVSRAFLAGTLPGNEDKQEERSASWRKVLAMVKALHDAHVRVAVGTDELDGLMLAHELELYVQAGIVPADALRMATIDSANAMRQGQSSGSIAVGKSADMFVVDGDPLAHIEDIRKVVSTMRGGVTFPAAQLLSTVGVAPDAP